MPAIAPKIDIRAKYLFILARKLIIITLVTTRNLNGLAPETSMASICSETFIKPNSAPILDPTFPAAIRAVISGGRARTIAMEIKEGNQEVAPNSDREGGDCFVNTIPAIKPVKVMIASYLYPMSKHCLIVSFNSNGPVNTSLKKRRINL
jgi:hypothetical protein